MHLSSIHHIAIIVSDYTAAKDFYVNKLGIQVIRENYRPERRDWKLDLRLSDTVELEIFAEENPPKRVNHPAGCAIWPSMWTMWRLWLGNWRSWGFPVSLSAQIHIRERR